MKKFTWFKHPNDLSNDKRVSALIYREGGQGYGTYLYIIEVLYMQPDLKLSFHQLSTMRRKGFGKAYMEKIIRNYKLFKIKGTEFESIINYGSPTKDSMETTPEASENAPESDENVSEDTPEYGRNQPNIKLECDWNQPDTKETPGKNEETKNACNSQHISEEEEKLILARVRGDKSREDKSREDENRKNDFVVKKNDADDEVSIPSSSLSPFRSWRELIDDLEPNSEWRERVCMTSGFSLLLNKYFKEALELFKEHVLLHGKEGNIDRPEEARSYFNNYAKEPRTSKTLEKALMAIDIRQQAAAPPDPYQYENRIDGLRTYLGCPIPDDAPPRPNAKAFWNESTYTWELQL